jgi:hypothetical protein
VYNQHIIVPTLGFQALTASGRHGSCLAKKKSSNPKATTKKLEKTHQKFRLLNILQLPSTTDGIAPGRGASCLDAQCPDQQPPGGSAGKRPAIAEDLPTFRGGDLAPERWGKGWRNMMGIMGVF